MTTLKLTMMLGPRETIEVCEAGMPDMPGVLFAADVVEGWDAADVERVLMAAGAVFREGIMARKYEEAPPPPKRLLAEVDEEMSRAGERLRRLDALTMVGGVPPPPPLPPLVRDTWGDPTPAERLVPEADGLPLSLRAEIARALAPEAWGEALASLRKADEVLAVVERRRTA